MPACEQQETGKTNGRSSPYNTAEVVGSTQKAIKIQVPDTFHPKAQRYVATGRSSDLPRFIGLPAMRSQWHNRQTLMGAYSSGDCPGFTPEFPINSRDGETNCAAKVCNI